MFIKKENFNYYGFNHKEVAKRFEGKLTYVGTFTVSGIESPVAVYHNTEPNREKNHKDYLMLYTFSAPFSGEIVTLVTGRDEEELKEDRMQVGVYCPKCKEVIYSIHRHDFRECKCGSYFIDGGKDYTRTNVGSQLVNIDLITGEVTTLDRK